MYPSALLVQRGASKIPNADVRQFNIIVDAFLELQNKGVVDVVINDTPVNEYYVNGRAKVS